MPASMRRSTTWSRRQGVRDDDAESCSSTREELGIVRKETTASPGSQANPQVTRTGHGKRAPTAPTAMQGLKQSMRSSSQCQARDQHVFARADTARAFRAADRRLIMTGSAGRVPRHRYQRGGFIDAALIDTVPRLSRRSQGMPGPAARWTTRRSRFWREGFATPWRQVATRCCSSCTVDGDEVVDDAEGELLAAHPGRAGVPIGVVVDMHANLSEQMRPAGDTVIAGYQTYPHVDFLRRTGARAAEPILRMVRGSLHPHDGVGTAADAAAHHAAGEHARTEPAAPAALPGDPKPPARCRRIRRQQLALGVVERPRDHRAVQIEQHGVAALPHGIADPRGKCSNASSSTGPLGTACPATGVTIAAPWHAARRR